MADIPVITPQVQEQVQPSVELPMNATAQAFGAGIGEAEDFAGDVATKLHREAAAHANQTAALDSMNKLAAFEDQRLHDPKTGVLNQRLGVNAPAAVEKTLEDHEKLANEISAKLTPQQQEQFKSLAQEHHRQVKRQLYGYENKELVTAQNSTDQSFVANTLNSIARAPDDQVGTMEKIGRLRATAAAAAKRNGGTDEDVKAAVDAVTSDAHMVVVRSLVDGDQGSAAKGYFEYNKDEIDAQGLAQAHSMLKTIADKDESRAVADSIINREGQKGDLPDLGADLQELENKNITDTAVYDQAKQRIVQRYELAQKAHNDTQQAKTADAMGILEDPANRDHEIPPSRLEGLDHRNYAAVMRYKAQLMKGDVPQTDPDVYADLQMKLADPKKWKEVVGDDQHAGSLNLEQYKSDLSPAVYRSMVAEIKRTRQKVIDNDDKLSQGQIATTVTDRLFKENGLEIVGKAGSTKRQDSAAMQGRFLEQLHKAVGAQAVEKQRDLNQDEIEQEAKKLLMETTWQHPAETGFQKFWYGTSGYTDFMGREHPQPMVTETTAAFKQEGADTFAYSHRDIPKEWIERFDASDKRTGNKRSPEERLRYYNDHRLDKKAQ